jgi:hypothetical protein
MRSNFFFMQKKKIVPLIFPSGFEEGYRSTGQVITAMAVMTVPAATTAVG